MPRSRGPEFEPYVGCRAYIKNKRKKEKKYFPDLSLKHEDHLIRVNGMCVNLAMFLAPGLSLSGPQRRALVKGTLDEFICKATNSSVRSLGWSVCSVH